MSNTGLVRVDRQKYSDALEYAGLEEIKVKGDVRVDRKGYSPDIGKKNPDYMDKKSIIVNKRQGNAPIFGGIYSFENKVLDFLYSENPLIKILRKEPIIIEFELVGGVGSFDLSYSMDTPSNDIKKIKRLQDRIEELTPRKLLDEEKTDGIVNGVKKIVKKFGIDSIENIDTNYLSEKKEIEDFSYKEGNSESFFWWYNNNPISFSFGEKCNPKIDFGSDFEKESFYSSMNLISKEKLCDIFCYGGYEIDSEKLSSRMDDISKEVMERHKRAIKKRYGITDINELSLIHRVVELNRYKKDLPEEWDTLLYFSKDRNLASRIDSNEEFLAMNGFIKGKNEFFEDLLDKIRYENKIKS